MIGNAAYGGVCPLIIQGAKDFVLSQYQGIFGGFDGVRGEKAVFTTNQDFLALAEGFLRVPEEFLGVAEGFLKVPEEFL